MARFRYKIFQAKEERTHTHKTTTVKAGTQTNKYSVRKVRKKIIIKDK